MAQRETLETFLKNLNTFDNKILKEVLQGFNRVTEQAMSDSQEKAPIASGNLVRSAAVLTAKQTENGVKSAVLYKAEYAKRLHDGNYKLKPAGAFSYYDKGQKWYKAQQGEAGWLQKAVDSKQENLINEVSRAIDEAWSRI